MNNNNKGLLTGLGSSIILQDLVCSLRSMFFYLFIFYCSQLSDMKSWSSTKRGSCPVPSQPLPRSPWPLAGKQKEERGRRPRSACVWSQAVPDNEACGAGSVQCAGRGGGTGRGGGLSAGLLARISPAFNGLEASEGLGRRQWYQEVDNKHGRRIPRQRGCGGCL